MKTLKLHSFVTQLQTYKYCYKMCEKGCHLFIEKPLSNNLKKLRILESTKKKN